MGRAHGLESKIVNDDQWYFHQALEAAFIGVNGTRSVQVTQQICLGGEQDIVALPDCTMPQCLSNMTLASTARAGNQQRDFLFNKATGRQIPEWLHGGDHQQVLAKTQDEPRYLVIGRIAGKHWSAITTLREESIRIVSVRRSRKEEVAIYES